MTKIQYMTKLLLFVACTAMVLTGCVRREQPELVSLQEERTDTSDGASAGTSSVSTEVRSEVTNTITVYVCGAVQSPGVYVLADGSRICDALEAAGGCLESADPSYLNQAEYVQDAQKLEVPTREEARLLREQGTPLTEGAQSSSEQGDGKVSINDADVTALMSLPGIGEGKAKAIIEYREKNGRFKSLEDLMNVPGIKQASFDKLSDRIKL